MLLEIGSLFGQLRPGGRAEVKIGYFGSIAISSVPFFFEAGRARLSPEKFPRLFPELFWELFQRISQKIPRLFRENFPEILSEFSPTFPDKFLENFQRNSQTFSREFLENFPEKSQRNSPAFSPAGAGRPPSFWKMSVGPADKNRHDSARHEDVTKEVDDRLHHH